MLHRNPIADARVVDHLQPAVLKIATLAGLSALSLTPWVVVTASGSRASRAAKDPRKPILAAGYVHCLFDGVNNLFVHESHRELADQLSYPACSRDEFTPSFMTQSGTQHCGRE